VVNSKLGWNYIAGPGVDECAKTRVNSILLPFDYFSQIPFCIAICSRGKETRIKTYFKVVNSKLWWNYIVGPGVDECAKTRGNSILLPFDSFHRMLKLRAGGLRPT
jgi:hypothetical protein